MAKAKKETVVEEVMVEEETVPAVNVPDEDELRERFINRRLAVINRMSDRAKAKRLAERILRNNRKG